ncbi:hypothetical protein QAD02_022688 [Eretmocerus hayati]|uniref:Uncharacterized protein n=1 Tax=Eretmocerus hayati TaxID=131215 RepID=A0ACC2PUC2_9HYME|nr:hypothetical protein QAD02_022688 [Eretmocerus hayati]
MRLYLHEASVLHKIRLQGARLYPFNDNRNDSHCVGVAHVFAVLRCEAGQQPEQSMKIAVTIGEAFAPSTTDAHLDNAQHLSIASVVDIMKNAFRNPGIIASVRLPDGASYAAFVANEDIQALFPNAEDFEAYPPTDDEVDAMELEDCAKILYYLAQHFTRPQRTIAIEMWAHAFAAIMEQGNASHAFLEKIAGECQTEFQTRVRLVQTALRTIYDFFMRGVTKQDAALVLGSLNINLPVSVIRFRLMTEHLFAEHIQ